MSTLPVLEPQTFTELLAFCERIATTSFVPRHFQGKPAELLSAVMYGRELGIGPMVSIQNLIPLHGKIVMPVELMLAKVESSGLLDDADDACDPDGQRWGPHGRRYDEATKVGLAWVKRKGCPRKFYTFSQADAARVSAKENEKWITLDQTNTYRAYPQRMYTARALGFALRDEFPDALKGIMAKEEMEHVVIDTYAVPSERVDDEHGPKWNTTGEAPVPASWQWVPIEQREPLQQAFTQCALGAAQQRVLLHQFKDQGAEKLLDYLRNEWATRNGKRRLTPGVPLAPDSSQQPVGPTETKEEKEGQPTPGPSAVKDEPVKSGQVLTAADINFGGFE